MEKLIKPVTIKFTADGEHDLHALARARCFDVSEYVRHLVAQDKKVMRQQWDALNQLFVKDGSQATETWDDAV